jgi:pimeloyl-ACP methyl ester carboxylesterase
MPAPSFVLVHSPLVGRATWRPTAEELRLRGYDVVVPGLAGVAEEGPPFYERLATRVAEAVRDSSLVGPLVVVGHSGAGALLPSIMATVQDRVMAAVFVDAILPHPGSSWMETVPPTLREQLRGLAVDGRLPPWQDWFPPGTIEALIPDSELRAGVLAEVPRLPLAYFDATAPTVDVAADRCAYLQLSAAYGPFADEAERRGWPTIREAADHLAITTNPGRVVDRLLELLDRLTSNAS